MREALVIGSGAREHALVQGLKASGARVWATPGNGGIAQDAEILALSTPDAVADTFGDRRPLVVIGPEAALAEGWSDVLRQRGFPVVGPSQQGAALESSKRLAKAVMQRYRIPTAVARTAHHPTELADWIRAEAQWPKVLKQSGLAQGKGVRIVRDGPEALAVLELWAGDAGIWQNGVLFEDYLSGYELSVQVVTNGRDYRWLPVAQDYKRLTPDAESPNTGGMGAVAPIPIDSQIQEHISRTVFDPMMAYLQDTGILYRGVLYAGLMMTAEGPRVLEFNVRLGDPETQAIVPLMTGDWWEFWWSVSQGEIPVVETSGSASVAVVLAAAGYPDRPRTGLPIQLGQDLPGTRIYHAATRPSGGHWESQGGRVLTVVGLGQNQAEARRLAYERVASIDFANSYHRGDIGQAD